MIKNKLIDMPIRVLQWLTLNIIYSMSNLLLLAEIIIIYLIWQHLGILVLVVPLILMIPPITRQLVVVFYSFIWGMFAYLFTDSMFRSMIFAIIAAIVVGALAMALQFAADAIYWKDKDYKRIYSLAKYFTSWSDGMLEHRKTRIVISIMLFAMASGIVYLISCLVHMIFPGG